MISPFFRICQNRKSYYMCKKIKVDFHLPTDYGRSKRKKPSMHGRNFNPNPKFLDKVDAYFVCHIGPIFPIGIWFMLSLGVRSPCICLIYFRWKYSERKIKKFVKTHHHPVFTIIEQTSLWSIMKADQKWPPSFCFLRKQL